MLLDTLVLVFLLWNAMELTEGSDFEKSIVMPSALSCFLVPGPFVKLMRFALILVICFTFSIY